jgi:hypothetical protein
MSQSERPKIAGSRNLILGHFAQDHGHPIPQRDHNLGIPHHEHDTGVRPRELDTDHSANTRTRSGSVLQGPESGQVGTIRALPP